MSAPGRGLGGLFMTCDDGPLAGASFTVARCPKVVRCVRSVADGTTDILNEPEDMPRLDEQVHWYQWDGRHAGHICGRGGCMSIVSLRYAPELVQLRHPDPVTLGAAQMALEL